MKRYASSLLSLSFLFLVTISLLPVAAHASEDAGLSAINAGYALPLMRPVQPVAQYPQRSLHFIDPLDVSKARMTSGFGWRVHPVLKDRRFHKGVDYAAPKGTHVYATEDGIIGKVEWRGNYGKLVTVRHSDHIETFYAHLSGYAPGIRPGVGVKKGDVIGYVGRTGLATGNHLYYEVVVNQEHINPLAEDLNEQVNVLAAQIARPDGRRLAEAQ